MSQQPKPPSPMRLSLKIAVVLRCSAADCLETFESAELPLVMRSVEGVVTVDRAELSAAAPAGWKLGSMRPRGLGLFVGPNQGSPLDVEPMPVCFCPTHNPEAGR
jgi:hypothetical protein